ncbi:M20 family metallopeptidase [Ramlibacter sp. G-1-2-2]|uniref:M20 family metallopeptidase n=1 Tax=Ramlibacter agri TaxID=2728837 RepID=A0A848H7P2_9BURK|nr:M20 family metallopeptidase [Ramlibacter agri]NML45380.1 M20 family metallopeptidase [Ramlibacter agri]
MTRSLAIQRAQDVLDSGALAATLARRVRYASESEEPQGAPVLRAYLEEEMAPSLAALGFTSQLHDNPVAAGLPLLVAERIEAPGLPTVLMYAHGDVVRGQAAQWREGLAPWDLHIEGERWYGRGTADNKGQHTVNLAALEQVIAARGGQLGFNLKLLVETGEEKGSPGLREFCEQQREALKADLFLASDGPRVQAARPTLFLGSRGALNFELRLNCRERAYHSGNWGGLLANPGIVLANAVASLVGPRGRILVDALRPREVPEPVRRALADIQVGGDADDPAVDADWGEPGLTPAERVIGWNSIEILAMVAGNPAQPVGAIPGSARVFCQMRFVVGTAVEDIVPALRAHLDAHGFQAVEIHTGASGAATRLDPEDPWVRWALESIQRSTGKRPALLPNLGGSLPNDIFANTLGLPTLWVPHSYPACAQHAPNEHLLAPVAREGLALMAGLFWDLGETGAAVRAARAA